MFIAACVVLWCRMLNLHFNVLMPRLLREVGGLPTQLSSYYSQLFIANSYLLLFFLQSVT